MERDLDLIRELLLRVESGPPHDFEVDGHSEHEVNFHLALLVDGGFLKGNVLRTGTPDPGKTSVLEVHVEHMTWRGHEFLDEVRNETVWSKVQDQIAEHGGEASLTVAKALASEIAKQHFGL